MNLVQDRWIPVRRRSGLEERIAPWEITDRYTEDPCVRLAAPRPDFNGAVVQFLIGLLQTAYAPRDVFDWKGKLSSPPLPQDLRTALSAVATAFDIDGDGPRFMQDLTLEFGLSEQERARLASDIGQLLVEMPGGQTLERNTDHFVKRGLVASMCPACAATALLTLQANAPSGGQGHRTSLRGGGPMTTVVLGRTLWETCWLNVLEIGEFLSLTGADREKTEPADCFPWLGPTRTSEGGRATTPSDGHPSQVFWGMPRRIRLVLEGQSWGTCDICGEQNACIRHFLAKNLGANYEGPWRHPLSPYFVAADGSPSAIHPQPGGIGFRHWLGLVIASTQGRGRKEPSQTVSRYLREGDEDLTIWAFGYDMDNMKARSWQDCTMPLLHCPPEALAEYTGQLARMIEAANQVADELRTQTRKALFWAGTEVGRDPSLLAQVARAFWQSTEPAFFALVPRVRVDIVSGGSALAAIEEWHGIMIKAAGAIFDEVSQSSSVDTANPKRIATAWNELRRNLYGRKLRELLGLPVQSAPVTSRRVGRRRNVARTG